jgi:hypothetical protein
VALLSPSARTEPSTLTLRDGSYYVLREPARQVGNRFVFRTKAGKTYSIDASEVRSTGPIPRPTPGPRKLDTHDSRQLGAIVRADRNQKGKAVEIAPSPPRRSSKTKSNSS